MRAAFASFMAFGGTGILVLAFMVAACWVEDHCYDERGRLTWNS